jgi:hypothetical protein
MNFQQSDTNSSSVRSDKRTTAMALLLTHWTRHIPLEAQTANARVTRQVDEGEPNTGVAGFNINALMYPTRATGRRSVSIKSVIPVDIFCFSVMFFSDTEKQKKLTILSVFLLDLS